MPSFFYRFYCLLGRHRLLPWFIQLVLAGLFVVAGLQLRLEGDLGAFLRSSGEGELAALASEVFEGSAIQDRVVLMLESAVDRHDSVAGEGVEADLRDTLVVVAEGLLDRLAGLQEAGLVERIEGLGEESQLQRNLGLIYDQLPLWITEEQYARLRADLEDSSYLAACVEEWSRVRFFADLVGTGDGYLGSDPLHLGSAHLGSLGELADTTRYRVYYGHLFTSDYRTLLLFFQPSGAVSSMSLNERLLDSVEALQSSVTGHGLRLHAYGSTLVSAYNSRCVERDMLVTVGLALVLILAFIVWLFRSVRAVLHLLLPLLFGLLFALAGVALVQPSLSLMAIGTGSIVVGVSLSYCVHVVTHARYVSGARALFDEISVPLTVGSITTIGAFVALIFARSPLLHDFGLLTSLWLIGTILYCLVFLPHLLEYGGAVEPGGRLGHLHHFSERLGGRGRPGAALPLVILAVTAVAYPFSRRVGFSSDLGAWNYQLEHTSAAAARLAAVEPEALTGTLITVSGKDADEAIERYRRLGRMADSLMGLGELEGHRDASRFLFSAGEWADATERWGAFWSEAGRGTQVRGSLRKIAEDEGLYEDEIGDLVAYVGRDFSGEPLGLGVLLAGTALEGWYVEHGAQGDSARSVSLSAVWVIPEGSRAHVYGELEELAGVRVQDRGYYLARIVEGVRADFSYLLLVSGAIVFLTLLASYGRIELALLAFLPLAVSWIIILALMYLLGMEFNLVNIVLSTLIFGIGDDFSIFVLDGVVQRYRDGTRILGKHRVGIVITAVSLMIAFGVLVFARHPAIRSIALSSCLGIAVVVFVSFSVTPFLFHVLTTHYTRRGWRPVTLFRLLRVLVVWVVFTVSSLLVLFFYSLLSLFLPGRRFLLLLRRGLHALTRGIFRTVLFLLPVRVEYGAGLEELRRGDPRLLIANHQSLLDILILFVYFPRVIMVTNHRIARSWLASFVRILGFPHIGLSYEQLRENVGEALSSGYSVLIFPEGTRSSDYRIRRFKQGTFRLSQDLGVSLGAVLLWGSGHVFPKRSVLSMGCGHVHADRLSCTGLEQPSLDISPREWARGVRREYVLAYAEAQARYAQPEDPFYGSALRLNYTYRSPFLEWKVRRQQRVMDNFTLWHQSLPLEGHITELGCGRGEVSLLLSLLSPGRRITGVDGDEGMIAVARHSYLRRGGVNFMVGDVRRVELKPSVGFILNHSLDRLPEEDALVLLERCVDHLLPGGVILIITLSEGGVSVNGCGGLVGRALHGAGERVGGVREPMVLCGAIGSFAAEHGLTKREHVLGGGSSGTLYVLGREEEEGRT